MTTSTAEHPAVTRFREYLRIKTMQPNPDYEGSTAFLINQANEIGMPYKVVEVKLGFFISNLHSSMHDPPLSTLNGSKRKLTTSLILHKKHHELDT